MSETSSGLTTHYLTDPNRAYAQVIEESFDLNSFAEVKYTYGDDLIAQHRRVDATTTTSSTYHYDGIGSTRALTSTSGAVTDTYAYSAFGEVDGSTGVTVNDYLYTGEQFDPNLGFYYLRARYYNPGVGRFQNMDTFMGRMHEPITLHKYLYGNADPVGMVDPSGRVASLAELSTGLRVVGVQLGKAVALYNLVDRTVDTLSLVHSLFLATQNLANISASDLKSVRDSFGANKNSRFAYATSSEGLADAAATFAKNSHRILRRIAKQKQAQLREFTRNRSAEFVLYMPSPEPNGLPALQIPTGQRITIPNKRGKRSVKLHFGRPGAGRMFGLGCNFCATGGSRKPQQWVRMDWHEPHGQANSNRYWIDGFWHFHIP